MTDDPHDATWIPQERKVHWCPVCQEEVESCECERKYNGPVYILLASVVIVFLTVLYVIATI